ncbi:hypothetical protein [Clostridium estertheticum]|uniref:hypothetical protein n=1 Tax=Clostridium estertheticum TaxID=238834 RepID=UPI00209A874D|nr:hypothetical protein [Clostridium estertheticum]
MLSMKLSKYIEVLNPVYVILKIVPDTSIRNYNSSTIAKAMNYTYRSITQRIQKEEKKLKWKLETPAKISFFIDIKRDDVSFYFIVPERHLTLIIEKIMNTWSKVAITIVDGINPFSTEAVKYQLKYDKEDAMSLNLDKKCNEPLNGILNVLDVLEDGDRVGIFYNFVPIQQKGWRQEHQRTMDKLKKNEFIDKEKFNITYILKTGAMIILDLVQDFMDTLGEFLGNDTKSKNLTLAEVAMSSLILEDTKKPTSATISKKDATVINTQILVISESKDKRRQNNTAIGVCESFSTINGDNKLVYKKIKAKNTFYINDFKIAGCEESKCSIEECQNFLELPGKELLSQHKIIKKIDALETKVPEQLRTGIIRVGMNMYKGVPSRVYQTEDEELRNTIMCICGPNRSGKTTYIANIVRDVMENGRSVILPDFCGKCELSDALAQVIPADKIINIDCNDLLSVQGFGFNELVPHDESMEARYICAKKKSAKLKELINLINSGESDLEGRMERYLEFAALVVFVSDGPVNDVFKIIKDHVLRHKYIDRIPAELKETMEEYVEELIEIDEIGKGVDNKGEVIGTKMGSTSAILSRIHRLKENAYIEKMLKKDCKDNINLIDAMQGGKLICIRMSTDMFGTNAEKDIFVCYWMVKMWAALQKRFNDVETENLTQVVILIDELYQVKNCEIYLTSILSQIARHRIKIILSCHHLAQIPVIQNEMKSALCSYTFIAGSNKKNFMAMKEEFADQGYELEDLLHLKRHNALNLLAYEEGYWAGITKLPAPIKKIV